MDMKVSEKSQSTNVGALPVRLAWRGIAMILLAANAAAADFRIGVNAEVSYRESETEVRQRYSPFLQELGKLTGHKFSFRPVYSDKVGHAVADKEADFLLIHTHNALRAEKEHHYQVVGFTQDRKNDQVYFLIKADSRFQKLADLAPTRIGVPGAQSWATATAAAELRRVGRVTQPAWVETRYQDAVPLMVELNVVGAGVTRSKKLVDDVLAQKKLRVLHTTASMPLNALIAAPDVPSTVVSDVRDAIAGLQNSHAFDALAFKALTYSAEQSKSLHDYYQ